MELIEREAAIKALQEHGVATGFGIYLLEHLPTIDPIKAAGGCYCRECTISGYCSAEEVFHIARVTDPFCCAGKSLKKETQDNG